MEISTIFGCFWLAASQLLCKFNPLGIPADVTTFNTKVLSFPEKSQQNYIPYSLSSWPNLKEIFSSQGNVYTCENGFCNLMKDYVPNKLNAVMSTTETVRSKTIQHVTTLNTEETTVVSTSPTVTIYRTAKRVSSTRIMTTEVSMKKVLTSNPEINSKIIDSNMGKTTYNDVDIPNVVDMSDDSITPNPGDGDRETSITNIIEDVVIVKTTSSVNEGVISKIVSKPSSAKPFIHDFAIPNVVAKDSDQQSLQEKSKTQSTSESKVDNYEHDSDEETFEETILKATAGVFTSTTFFAVLRCIYKKCHVKNRIKRWLKKATPRNDIEMFDETEENDRNRNEYQELNASGCSVDDNNSQNSLISVESDMEASGSTYPISNSSTLGLTSFLSPVRDFVAGNVSQLRTRLDEILKKKTSKNPKIKLPDSFLNDQSIWDEQL